MGGGGGWSESGGFCDPGFFLISCGFLVNKDAGIGLLCCVFVAGDLLLTYWL